MRTLVVIAISLIACGDTTRSVAGVTVERTKTASGYESIRISGSPQAVTATKGRLIGDKEGANILHEITSLLLDDAGNVYVASAGTKRIAVFDSAGKHLRDIGRAGQGPGEFSSPESMVWQFDTLFVNDPDNARIAKFSNTGEPRGSQEGFRANTPLIGIGDSAFATTVFRRNPLRRVFLFHWTGGRVDSVPHVVSDSLPKSNATGVSIDCVTSDRVLIFSTTQRRGQPIQHPGADGTLLVVLPDAFRLIFLRKPLDTARVIERVVQPLAVSEEEWRVEEERYNEFRSKVPPLSQCTSNSLPRVTHVRVVRDVFLDSHANLWVDAVTSEGRFFEVFDSKGSLLKRIATVPRLESVVPYVRGNTMAVVETDSLDIQQVRLYRLGEVRR